MAITESQTKFGWFRSLLKAKKFYHRASEGFASVSGKLGSLCDPIKRCYKVLNFEATPFHDKFK